MTPRRWAAAGLVAALVAVLLVAYVARRVGEPGHAGPTPVPATSRPHTAQEKPSLAPTVPGLGHVYRDRSHNDAGHEIAATTEAVGFDMRVQSSDAWRPRPGHDYAGLTVRVCITADPRHEGVEVSWAPWTLVYADGTTLQPATADQMEIGPVLYPDGMVTPVGACRKGVIPFVVKRGHRPAFAEYSTPNSLTQYRWRLAP